MKYDCIVIGSGPAGYYSALSCSKKGYRTAIIEKDLTGGTGFRTGCLPVKMSLDVLRKVREATTVSAGELKISPEFHKNLLQNTWTRMKGIELRIEDILKKSGIDFLKGNGQFLDSKTYLLNNTRLESDYFMIASGTSPSAPGVITIDGSIVISHIEALGIKELPDELVIIGANVEGIEMASLFSSLGVQVTVIEQLDEVLAGTDRDLIQPVMDNLAGNHVKIITGASADTLQLKGDRAFLTLRNGLNIQTGKILVTGNRKLNIPDGLERTGVMFTDEKIPVDETLQTNIPGIYVTGDANGIMGMAHVAIQQGRLITEGLSGRKAQGDYSALPRAMFTVPEIAGAGKQEWEMKKEGKWYRVKKFHIKDTWRAFSRGIEYGSVKIILDQADVLSGIWMTCPDASEILSSSGLLIGRKITGSKIMDTLFIHPTLGEGILEAAFL